MIGQDRKREAVSAENISPASRDASVPVRDPGAGFNAAWTGKGSGPFQRPHRLPEFEETGMGRETVQWVIHRRGDCPGTGELKKGATWHFHSDIDIEKTMKNPILLHHYPALSARSKPWRTM